MGLLDKLLGKKESTALRVETTQLTEQPKREVVDARDEARLPTNAVLLGGQGRVEVKGESHYQDALSRVCGGKSSEGHLRKVLAILEPEFENPYDKNAIAVHVDGELVGYMAKESAADYAPIAKLLSDKGKIGAARAFIRGGWLRPNDEGHFGIELELSSTPELLKTRKITTL